MKETRGNYRHGSIERALTTKVGENIGRAQDVCKNNYR